MVNKQKKVVIVGGGTAGLTIAKRLQGEFNVTVVEKSQYLKYPIIYKIPLLIGFLFRNKKSKYISKINLRLTNGRDIPFFESNLLGGASVINGCVHTIGSKFHWDSILKPFDLSYKSILDTFNDLFSKNRSDVNKITLTTASQNIIDNAFIKGLNSINIPVGDMNYSDIESCGPILNTSKKFFRSSIISILGKKLFKISNSVNVQSLIYHKDGSVAGVKTNNGPIFSDYVILSGGVIGTNSLLLEEKYNNKEKYELFKSLNIGKDIKDHTNLRVNVLTNKNIGSLNEISKNYLKRLILLLKHFSGKSTLMTGTGATSAAHLDLNNDGIIDTRIQIVQFTEKGRHGSDGNYFSNMPGFSISITVINPKSKGVITTNGSKKTINPMYLSSGEDIELLKLSLKFCLKLLHSQPINDHILEIIDEDIIENEMDKYIFNNIFSGHHLIGGLHNAVNTNFEVHKTKGLYVCDASIFEKYAASNIHSSVILIADLFSKKFINNNIKI